MAGTIKSGGKNKWAKMKCKDENTEGGRRREKGNRKEKKQASRSEDSAMNNSPFISANLLG